jgi:hypothetical protein
VTAAMTGSQEPQKRHGCRRNAQSFVLALVQELAALATTGGTPCCPRCGVVIMARSVVSNGARLIEGLEDEIVRPAQAK